MEPDIGSLAALPHCVLHRVFSHLSARDLCRASAVCRLWRDLNRDVVGERRWQRIYTSRWPLRDTTRRWTELYSEKVLQCGAFKGRFFQDGLFGHKAGVRSIQLLPERNLLATGSLDKSVRLWDLEQGMHICTSRLHEGTVRSVILTDMPGSDALRLVSGSDVTIRIWMLRTDAETVELGEPVKLKGHTGPISRLSAMGDLLFSGSWDCSVCLWSHDSEEEWKVASRFVYPDWIWDIRAKQRQFVVCCGRKVIVQSSETGKEIVSISDFLTEGHVSCCEATEDERFVMTGSTDSIVRLHDVRCRNQATEIASHGSGISSLSFDDPWIAAGSLDGTVSLTNIEEKLHTDPESVGKVQGNHNRQLQCHSGPVYCIDMKDQWIACGAEKPIVRTWDFTRAVAAAKKAEIARAIRKNRKNRTHILMPLHTEPVLEEEACTPTEDDSTDDTTPTERFPSCRLQHRQTRRNAFWNSFGWGDSTDDSEIIDAFG